jgi:hypothetical protein
MYWTKAFAQELSRLLIVSDAILEICERGGTHHRGEVATPAERAIRLFSKWARVLSLDVRTQLMVVGNGQRRKCRVV